MARDANLAGIAITDHDTVAGIAEALNAGREYGVQVIPGVEISTSAGGRDIHILGYGIDTADALLLERLVSQRQVRVRRNEQIVTRLNELGMALTLREVEEAAAKSSRGDGTIGRPHFAEVLVRKGYVKDVREAFDRFLAEGKPAFVNPPRIHPLEAIRWIHEAGGRAIVAHPGLYHDDRLVFSLLEGGADGLEADHSDHDEETAQKYRRIAGEHGKLATGGSDFHGSRDGEVFHGPIGNRTVPSEVVARLLQQRHGA
jgi:hypothetical protein